MKYIGRLLIFMIVFGQSVFSQEQFKTSLKVEQVRQEFSKGGKISWAVPISQGKTLSVVWQERPNSLAGVQTFVGYKEDELIGVLSIDATSVSGNFNYDGNTYKITSEKRKVVVTKEDENQTECGVCCGENHNHTTQRPSSPDTENNKCAPDANGFLDNHCLDNIQIYTDGVLRIYRLALLINYSQFQNHFKKDKQEVRRFWAATEAFANELYVRAVAVKFTIVDDEALIRDTPEKEILKNYRYGYQMLQNQRSTQAMNEVIAPDKYDVGLIVTFLPRVNGQAAMEAAHSTHTKADGVIGRPAPSTVAHELGHMFGADHTFATGEDSGKVEPERGRSIMGYGHSFPRDFFTLYSVHSIRRGLTHSSVYFSDKERTQKVMLARGENPIYGIKTSNRRPVIDASKLKKKYAIPQSTYFQFRINASDPDNDKLIYAAHQTDIRLRTNPSNALYYSAKPSYNNVIRFQQEYKKDGTIDHFFSTQGIYRFWLAASDGILGQEALTNETHATHYDMVKTDVEVKNGTPFVIASNLKKTYSAGEQVELRWNVDKSIFGANSKVRILLSDDFGQTFKHIIVSETDNNGTFTFTMPHIKVTKNGNRGNGLVKIEVLDHIAYAVSDYNPSNGGFEITPSAITFENLPEPTIYVKEKDIPENYSITAVTTCSNQAVNVKYTDERKENFIKRTFSATDNCQNQASFVQHIFIEEDVLPLQFVGVLPQDKVYHCEATFDKTLPNVQVVGGKSPTIELTQTRMESDYHINYILKRTWRVTDPVAKPIEHTQLVFVYDSTAPILVTNPQDIIVNNESEAYNYVETPPVAFDNCGNKLQWRRPISPDYKFGSNGLESVSVIWEARDGTFNTVRVTQKIIVDKNATDIYFQNLPADMQLSCKDGIPQVVDLKVVNCSSAQVSHTQTEKIEGGKKIITRIYKAEGCGKIISATQRITITDDEAPTFIGKLPENISVANSTDVPPLVDLSATDNCFQSCSQRKIVITTESNPRDNEYYNSWKVVGDENCVKTVQVTKNRTQSVDGKVVTDTWIATDEFGNTQTYSRTIKVASPDVPKTITFLNFPTDVNLSCGKDKPQAESKLQVSNCDGTAAISVTHTDTETGDCKTGKTIVRTYMATVCGQTISQKQTITIAGDNEAPVFSGELPKDISITENQEMPTQETLTATDNCSAIQVTKSQEEKQEGENKIIIYKWEASDNCGNRVTHTQKITIQKSSQPTPPTDGVQPPIGIEPTLEMIVYNGVSTESGSENYLKFEPIENYKNLQIEIFNELGQKVYESKNYQKNGEVFRGYANVKGVFRKGKRLPTGTYFYVLKYQDITGKSNTKQGYLFVR
ncbi:reprolysin-like metallopeptidase [Capnocytophaga cynodegmi]|uniref:reprolysin-like metallopeptidase n=1 Tax=Capnocytophaga cynodegmi TaxID=28189 RepID=UPI003858E606